LIAVLVKKGKLMKLVIITGGSRGIGRQTAITFAKAGYAVAVNYNNSEKEAKQLCEEIKKSGGNAVPFKADISEEKQVKEMFSAIYEHFHKGADILINNAGIAISGLFTDIDTSTFKHMFDVNVFGTILCCKEALPYMISNKKGCIINTSSIWGIAGASCEVHYSASKAAIIGLTKALAKEVGLSGITVNCIAPGVIMTDMNKNLKASDIDVLKDETPLNSIGETADIAELALFLASQKAKFITGQVISPNGGLVI